LIDHQFADKFYGPLAFTMPLLVAGSCFGTVNGVMLTSSRSFHGLHWGVLLYYFFTLRLFFVAGRNEHMPSVLSYINPYWNTPIPAVLFTVRMIGCKITCDLLSSSHHVGPALTGIPSALGQHLHVDQLRTDCQLAGHRRCHRRAHVAQVRLMPMPIYSLIYIYSALRISKPPRDYPRPLKVNMIFPVIFLAGCMFLVIFPMSENFHGSPKNNLLT
jgi:hypothetical protein